MLLRQALLVGLDQFLRHIGVVKEPQPDLDGEDAAHGLVNDFRRHRAFFNLSLQVILVNVRAHIHIHARKRGFNARVAIVLGDTVGHALADGVGVADHKAIQTEFALEHIPLDIQELLEYCISGSHLRYLL